MYLVPTYVLTIYRLATEINNGTATRHSVDPYAEATWTFRMMLAYSHTRWGIYRLRPRDCIMLLGQLA